MGPITILPFYMNHYGIYLDLLLLVLRRVNLRRGEIFLTYLIWYSIGRFFVEGLRTDSLMLTESIRMAQMISVVLIVGAIAVLIYRRVKGYADIRYLDKPVVAKATNNKKQKKIEIGFIITAYNRDKGRLSC